MLIEKGADLNVQDEFRNTPLHCAADVGSIGCCKALVFAEADLLIRSPYAGPQMCNVGARGGTAADLAKSKGFRTLFKFLKSQEEKLSEIANAEKNARDAVRAANDPVFKLKLIIEKCIELGEASADKTTFDTCLLNIEERSWEGYDVEHYIKLWSRRLQECKDDLEMDELDEEAAEEEARRAAMCRTENCDSPIYMVQPNGFCTKCNLKKTQEGTKVLTSKEAIASAFTVSTQASLAASVAMNEAVAAPWIATRGFLLIHYIKTSTSGLSEDDYRKIVFEEMSKKEVLAACQKEGVTTHISIMRSSGFSVEDENDGIDLTISESSMFDRAEMENKAEKRKIEIEVSKWKKRVEPRSNRVYWIHSDSGKRTWKDPRIEIEDRMMAEREASKIAKEKSNSTKANWELSDDDNDENGAGFNLMKARRKALLECYLADADADVDPMDFRDMITEMNDEEVQEACEEEDLDI